jgi:hypothetical protein
MAARCDPRRRHDHRQEHPGCVYGETCEQVRRVTAETWGAYSAAEHPDYGTILYSAHLANLLADMGMRRLGPDKRVPDAVWSWPRAPAFSRIVRFIRG